MEIQSEKKIATTSIPNDAGPDSLESGSIAEIHNGRGNATAIPDELITNDWQRRANNWLATVGGEARGVERVDEVFRPKPTSLKQYGDMATIWFSINLTANILTIGVLGPVTFGLGTLDSMMCCFFGTIFGSIVTCYMATFGAMSGNRTLVVSRFIMGWWPTRVCVVLAAVVTLGYGMVDAVTTGLIFSAVSNGGVSVILGIIIFGLIVWIVSVFGIKYFQMFERYAYIPQVCVLFILVGVAAPHMDVNAKSALTGNNLIGARISYFFTCASGPMGWAAFISDSFCYYSPKTHRGGIWLMTFLGFVASKTFVEFIGIGLGSGLAINPSWEEGFKKYGVGGLIIAAYSPLGSLGNLCGVIMGLGIAANMVPGNYSASFCVQVLSRRLDKVPRIVWNTVATIIYVVVGIAGRNKLLTIFSNFLPLIGYWVIIWITIFFEEEFFFRRRLNPAQPFDWSLWDTPSKLPLGLAAFTAFVIGWIGAILCMNQVYFVGPIAKLVPADMGIPVAMSWAAVVFPPLRHLELKKIGR